MVLIDSEAPAPRVARRTAVRLLIATAGSVLLHALALSSYAPGGAMATPRSARPLVLQASLVSLDPTPEAQRSVPASTGDEQQGDASGTTSGTRSEAGKVSAYDGDGSAQRPGPDRWYKASEVDVRAEPIGEVNLDYPAGVNRSGPPAKVRVRLYIDERGVVRKVELAASAAERVFDQAATKAWEEVRFSPAIKNGIAVKSQKLLEIDYLPN